MSCCLILRLPLMILYRISSSAFKLRQSRRLFRGIPKVRALTSDELECLDVFLAMAACRFGQCVCKLLKNKEEGRTGDDILQKTRKKCEQ